MNKAQIVGIGSIGFGIVIYYLVENDILQTISGALCAFGLGLVLKLIAFKKQNVSE